ncbi:MAG TPA: HrpE/YscL family type III secretion apparatus protein [Chlamydiales bacterium]|nr:HrpE/YscL family type III secretion apparatus protein [Chlamydiales bacterium]
MKDLEKSDDKIQKICDLLKNETLAPAKQQAKEIIENAQIQAKQIVDDAKNQKEKILEETKASIEKEKTSFESSLKLASSQVVEKLKIDIQQKLFSPSLNNVLSEKMEDPEIVAKFLEALIHAVDEEGLDLNVEAFLSKNISKKEFAKLLLQKSIQQIQENALTIGDFEGGVKLQLKDQNLTIDLSKESVAEMLANYVRSDYRSMLFGI